jgi:hypothetical protein
LEDGFGVVALDSILCMDWREDVVVSWERAGDSSGGDGRISSAEMATSNLRLSSIVPRLAAVAGRPSLAESSSSASSIPWAKL